MRINDTAQAVAAEVRAEMARQGISATALADRLGWSQPRISRRLTDGKTAVPFEVAELIAVADALRVPVAKFLPEPAVPPAAPAAADRAA